MDDFFDGEWQGGNDKPLYTKLEDGETKLRILSKALLAWEGWYNSKPVRFAHDYKITADEYATLDRDNYDSSKAKWKQVAICVVWNYDEEAVQYWQFGQKQIRDGIMTLARDSDWGDLTGFDIKVKREGKGMDTKYSVLPSNKGEVSQTIKDAVLEKGLTPEQVLSDKKNLENIEVFKSAVKLPTPKDAERIAAEDIPF